MAFGMVIFKEYIFSLSLYIMTCV